MTWPVSGLNAHTQSPGQVGSAAYKKELSSPACVGFTV